MRNRVPFVVMSSNHPNSDMLTLPLIAYVSQLDAVLDFVPPRDWAWTISGANRGTDPSLPGEPHPSLSQHREVQLLPFPPAGIPAALG